MVSFSIECLGETQNPLNSWITPRKEWILLGCLAVSIVVNVALTLALILNGQLLQGKFLALKRFWENTFG
jgi:hypothetical protein